MYKKRAYKKRNYKKRSDPAGSCLDSWVQGALTSQYTNMVGRFLSGQLGIGCSHLIVHDYGGQVLVWIVGYRVLSPHSTRIQWVDSCLDSWVCRWLRWLAGTWFRDSDRPACSCTRSTARTAAHPAQVRQQGQQLRFWFSPIWTCSVRKDLLGRIRIRPYIFCTFMTKKYNS